ncbi:MAG: hypothetical protein AAF192_13295 [Pseudomonadota bacterium]
MIRTMLLSAAVALLSVSSASALTSNGITFTSLSPGLTLDSLTGTGTSADPFVLSETLSTDDGTLSIEGLDTAGLDPLGIGGSFYLSKTVTNASGFNWSFFDLELQSVLGEPSDEFDGLSFAQGNLSVRPFTSDVFVSVFEESIERDQVNFFDATVLPGQTVTMNFVVSDNSPASPFYLRQRPNFVDPAQRGDIPLPAALPLLATGAAALFGLARRRRAAG